MIAMFHDGLNRPIHCEHFFSIGHEFAKRWMSCLSPIDYVPAVFISVMEPQIVRHQIELRVFLKVFRANFVKCFLECRRFHSFSDMFAHWLEVFAFDHDWKADDHHELPNVVFDTDCLIKRRFTTCTTAIISVLFITEKNLQLLFFQIFFSLNYLFLLIPVNPGFSINE